MRGGYIADIKVAYFRDDLPEPQLERPGDVKIRIRACGICGSEVHAYLGEHPFRIPPLVSGHEVSGDVVAIGDGVTTVKVGDRVVIEPQYGCGECCIASITYITYARARKCWAQEAGVAAWVSIL